VTLATHRTGRPGAESLSGAASPAIEVPRAEPVVRFTLAGGRIGVPSLGLYLRTLADAIFWLGAAPLPARLLWRTGSHRASAYVQRWWASGLEQALGLHIEWDGLDRIDPEEAYVVTPLHEGLADVLALLKLPLRLRFAARDELAEWRVLGTYLRDTGQLIIRPEDGADAYWRLLRGAREVFAAGESLVVFPQGSILGIETDFHSGAFALARSLERPILPVALTGGHRVWEHPYSPRLRRGERMSMRVLPPISTAEVQERAVDELRCDVRRRLKAAAIDGTMVPPRRFIPARDGYWDCYAYDIDPAFPSLAADIAAHRNARRRNTDMPPLHHPCRHRHAGQDED
jgi:1-acyl-sn-glycerol-3-phosphate acyltransferase